MASSRPPISMRRWSYNEQREPEVTVLAAERSRVAQLVEVRMDFRFSNIKGPPAFLRVAGFARVDGICEADLQLTCAESRAPHGARVD